MREMLEYALAAAVFVVIVMHPWLLLMAAGIGVIAIVRRR